MATKTYLITGGTGFIGSASVRALLERGHGVRVLDDDSRGSRHRLEDVKDNIDWRPGDVRNPVHVLQAVEGVDSVLHLAAVNGTEHFYNKPELVLEVAVKGMLNVLDACIAHDVRDLIVASSSEVYQTPPKIPTDETAPLIVPDPFNARYSYGGGKIISELLTINYGRKFFDRAIIFRPHNVFGPDMGNEHVVPQFIVRMSELFRSTPESSIADFSIQGNGKETRAFIYIDDFIDALMLLMERGETMNIYHVGNNEETSIENLARTVARVLGREINIIPGKLLEGSTMRRSPDIRKMTELGFQTKWSLEDGIKESVKFYSRT